MVVTNYNRNLETITGAKDSLTWNVVLRMKNTGPSYPKPDEHMWRTARLAYGCSELYGISAFCLPLNVADILTSHLVTHHEHFSQEITTMKNTCLYRSRLSAVSPVLNTQLTTD